ncbi:hypothetical protein H4J58_00460 [Colwellia sp. MB3u-70]|jgi:hypothetical protein|uniref:hypothetical protein n=1 Tax=unclassified Colwellia TaxID=196834 RepID=UPI0015F5E95F|nr:MULTISPECIES: hypothetical protein [unclassified Colwellia]MBA6293505.1 hypothetical protein [Colwellia sp. MB3u-8]MBA6305614.1 hypothetical protein [Colwellia sp. MB3u-70]
MIISYHVERVTRALDILSIFIYTASVVKMNLLAISLNLIDVNHIYRPTDVWFGTS